MSVLFLFLLLCLMLRVVVQRSRNVFQWSYFGGIHGGNCFRLDVMISCIIFLSLLIVYRNNVECRFQKRYSYYYSPFPVGLLFAEPWVLLLLKGLQFLQTPKRFDPWSLKVIFRDKRPDITWRQFDLGILYAWSVFCSHFEFAHRSK